MADNLIIGDLDPKAAVRLVESTSDLVVLLDAGGRVLEVAIHDGSLSGLDAQAWVGKLWVETVTVESREKLVSSLKDAANATPARWRQVNHPFAGGEDLPVLYMTVPVQAECKGLGRMVAFGRDLRSTVALQRRLVEAQQTMERDYWRFREADTRYRHLLQTSQDALLVVDGQNQRVVEANAASDALAGKARGGVVGMSLPALFDAASAEPLQSLLAAARAVGKRDPVRLTLADGGDSAVVSATLFRQDQLPFMLVRVVPSAKVIQAQGGAAGLQGSTLPAQALYQSYVGHASDGLVFTDAQGRVVLANRTFALMAQLSAEEQARGEMLDRWLGRTGVELSVLVTNLRQRGSVGLFTTALRGEFGGQIEVEISASMLALPDGSRLAFAIRDISRRLQGEERTPDRVSRSVSELTELVGRVPLKDIVSETTELIEQLCIEAALQMTHGNRASAAQLLGLSRQSLYVKLNRFGLAGGGSSDTYDERPAVNID
jgi:transcriptional regulator PpsR